MRSARGCWWCWRFPKVIGTPCRNPHCPSRQGHWSREACDYCGSFRAGEVLPEVARFTLDEIEAICADREAPDGRRPCLRGR